MKVTNVSKGLLLGLTLLLATSVFAANNKGSLETLDTVTINGKTLPAGNYSLKWDGTGSAVQVNIMKGSKVVATTSAKLVDLNDAAKSDSAVLRSNGDGTRSLAEVRFEGKKYALEIGGESTSADATGSTK